MNIKSILCFCGLLLTLASCRPSINTDTAVTYNKFKKSSTIHNTDNWVHQLKGCKELAFDFILTLKEDEDLSVISPSSKLCAIVINTRAGTQVSIEKGCHLWIFADGNKTDLVCNDYSGKKKTTVSTTGGYYSPVSKCYFPGSTSSEVTYHETSIFVTNLKTLCELAEAKQIWFEIETGTSREIEGVFGEKNYISLRNFVQEIEQRLDTNDKE